MSTTIHQHRLNFKGEKTTYKDFFDINYNFYISYPYENGMGHTFELISDTGDKSPIFFIQPPRVATPKKYDDFELLSVTDKTNLSKNEMK